MLLSGVSSPTICLLYGKPVCLPVPRLNLSCVFSSISALPLEWWWSLYITTRTLLRMARIYAFAAWRRGIFLRRVARARATRTVERAYALRTFVAASCPPADARYATVCRTFHCLYARGRFLVPQRSGCQRIPAAILLLPPRATPTARAPLRALGAHSACCTCLYRRAVPFASRAYRARRAYRRRCAHAMLPAVRRGRILRRAAISRRAAHAHAATAPQTPRRAFYFRRAQRALLPAPRGWNACNARRVYCTRSAAIRYARHTAGSFTPRRAARKTRARALRLAARIRRAPQRAARLARCRARAWRIVWIGRSDSMSLSHSNILDFLRTLCWRRKFLRRNKFSTNFSV